LTDVQVDSGPESTTVTLVGLTDAIYTAVYDADLQAVVIELASVDAESAANRVEIYDGIIDHVTTSTFSEDGGESITRVEIALGAEASYTIAATEEGLSIDLVEGGVPMASGSNAGDELFGPASVEGDEADEWADAGDEVDPWADAEGSAQADDVALSVAGEGSDDSLADASTPDVGIAPPPVATALSAVEVESLDTGVLVHLKANGSILTVQSFVLENPDRLVVDLPGMTLESGIPTVSVDHAMVARVRVGGHADKVRVVIDGGEQSLGFSGRSIKPSADGLYLAVGSGDEIELALTKGLDAATTSWVEQALASIEPVVDPLAEASSEFDELAGDELPSEWPASAAATAMADDVALESDANLDAEDPELAEATTIGDDWELTAAAEAAPLDESDPSELAEVTPVDAVDATVDATDEASETSSVVAVHGVHYTPMDNLDRIAVLSEAVVDYQVHSPDADTLIVSLFGATIAPEAAGRIRGKSGGPVSLITIFQQPDVVGSEVRLVVTRAPNQEPLVSRRGSLLFIDFENLGVAAAAPPAFPEAETVGSQVASLGGATAPAAANSEASPWDEGVAGTDSVPTEAGSEVGDAGEQLVAQPASFDELPEFSENPGLDGPAGMDPAFAEDDLDPMAASDEYATLTPVGDDFGDFDDFDDFDDFETADFQEAGPASLEPPAAVEMLQEGGLVDGKKYAGRRISLDFNDVPISDVLRLIAEVSDLNLIAGDEVKGKVTIRLVDVPWDQALDVVLLTKGLGFVRVGNILRVAPADIIAAEEELRLQERRNKEKLEDLMVKLLPVNYASVKDMQKLAKRLLSSRGTVNIDERTNTLILKDIASVIDETVALVKAVDTETPQVMIEAKIVEANLNFSRELGSTWGIVTQPFVDPFTGSVGRDDLGTSNFRFHGSNGVSFSNPITSTPTALADLGAFLLDEKLDLNVQLRAAESMGEGKVISSPRIVTLDNGEATIEQGVSIPFQTFEGGDAKLEFIDAVLSLKVTPHITSDRSIIMDIEVTRNAPDDSVPTPTGSPAIAKAEASTQTLVKDGQTLVIGGIYTINKSERESRVPYLYRLPIIGTAFRSKELTDIRKELLIFVTPRIIKSPSLATKS
jgi:type IV pilus secretin PilQ/predicted competence protein